MTHRICLLSAMAVMFAACGDSGSTTASTGTASETGTTQADPTTTTSASTDADTTAQSGTDSQTAGPTTTTTPDETTVASESSSDTTAGVDETTTTTTTGDPDTTDTSDTGTTGEPPPPSPTYLWYSVDQSLIYIELNPADGTAVEVVANELVPDVALADDFNGLTVLTDGTLLGSRLNASSTLLYHVPDPPTTPNTPAQAQVLGEVLGEDDEPLLIEALYTDCMGRVYLMDTGPNDTTAAGNRLLRFTGDYLAGDFAFEVLTDLENASIADIDDMSPGIVMDSVDDKVGFAIDSGTLWQVDYTTGTGMQLAQTAGKYGIHALGGMLFDDNVPRLYVLSVGDMMLGPDLYMVNLDDYTSSDPLITGPVLDPMSGFNGFSGLAGPLTDCVTALPG